MLLQLMLATAVALDSGTPWHEAETGTLTVTGNVAPERIASLAREIAAFRSTFDTILPQDLLGHEAPRRISVFAFDSRQGLRRHFPAAPRGVAGVYVATPLADYILIDAASESGRETALHEAAHQRLRAGGRPLAAWLSEGLAYWCQTFRIVEGEAELGRPVAGIPTSAAMPLGDLLATDASAPRYATRNFAGSSFVLVHYLLSRQDDERERADRLFRSMARGEPSASALEAAFDGTLERLDARLAAYRRAGLRPARRAVGAAAASPGSAPRRLTPAESLVRLGELRYAAGGDTEGAAAFFAEALLLAPGDRRAVVGQALAWNAMGRREAARDRLRELLVAAPDDTTAWFALGETSMGIFADWRNVAPEGEPREAHPALLAAREAYARVMALEPALVAAHDNFARTWLFDPAPHGPGIAACEAVLARTGDAEIGLTLVRLHADEGDRTAAHAARDRHVLPWRSSLGHRSAAWEPIARGLLVADIVLAQRLEESGRPGEALDVLSSATAVADAELVRELESRIARLRLHAVPPS